ncbi:MAG: hypothetical protein V3V10_04745 [Planctomycetota bacterium]
MNMKQILYWVTSKVRNGQNNYNDFPTKKHEGHEEPQNALSTNLRKGFGRQANLHQ